MEKFEMIMFMITFGGGIRLTGLDLDIVFMTLYHRFCDSVRKISTGIPREPFSL